MNPTRHGGSPSVRRGLMALAAIVVLGGCVSGPEPVASFVTGDGPQYFVRPVEFRGVGETEGTALLDVTVRQLRDTGTAEAAATAATTDASRADDAGTQGAGGIEALSPPVQVNFTVPLHAARGLATAELRSGGERFPLDNLERFFARVDTARYGSTMPRERFDRLRAQPTEVELVIAADDNGGGTSAEFRYAAAEPWVRRMEILNLMLAE